MSTPHTDPHHPSHPAERRGVTDPKGSVDNASPTPASNRSFVFPGAEGTVMDPRVGIDRRAAQDKATGLDRRRGAGRRRSDFLKAADEGELTKEQFMFLMAIQAFKKANQTMFPTWTDVLEVIRLLGYRKTMPSELKLGNTEDWREGAEAPANVRTIDGKTIRRAA